ncbi:MAG: ABC transporter permease subunit [Microbacteriaceae bacterium]|jgi:ABC-type nitrate/sulfonate/bicarbonate transport system permease component|nr:ABC transporter permease subunit [Microbacteriaceae bacterium]MCI1206732.1 ABC transporter permease subunit [Microbacteriaceae bacterium]
MSEPIGVEDRETVQQRTRAIRARMLRSVLTATGRAILTALITLLVIGLLWWGLLVVFNLSPYVTRGPLDVWNYLVTAHGAAAHRLELLPLLGVTLAHSALGFALGMGVAVLAAISFRLSSGIEGAFMPVAMLLRSVPLVTIAPVIILIFGIGSSASVAVIAGIVVLFPALVTIVQGLRSASPQMLEVVSVYGGSEATATRKVALPAALPAIFAAIRISVPGAITGALLAEWLSTGDGIGAAVQKYIPQAEYDRLWAAVVAITFVSVLLYSLVQLIESIVLARMGMADRH